MVKRDPMPDGAAFLVRGDHGHLVPGPQTLVQGLQTRCVNTIVIGEKNVHICLIFLGISDRPHLYKKTGKRARCKAGPAHQTRQTEGAVIIRRGL